MNTAYEILFLVLPLLLCGGLFIKKKGLSCLFCFMLFFIVSAFYLYDWFAVTYPQLPEYNMDLEGTVLNPAFYYSSKLLSILLPDYRGATLVWAVFLSGTLTLYLYKYCYYTVLSAITAAASGLWLINFINPSLFMGVLIAAFAFRYASERRFVRYLAVMLLAVSFDLRLAILVPLYIIFITKPTLYHIIGAALAASALLFFDLSPVFGIFIGYGTERAGAELFLPVTIAVVCVVSALASKIIMRRGSYNGTMITVLTTAAVLGVGAAADGRFLLPAAACFFPAALTLIPEIAAVAKSIIALTFREKKKPLLIAGAVILALGAGIYYAAVLSSSGIAAETWIGVTVQP